MNTDLRPSTAPGAPRSLRHMGPVLALLAGLGLPAHAQLTSPADANRVPDPAPEVTTTAQAGASGVNRDAYSLLPYTRRGYVGLNLGRPELDVGCGLAAYPCDDADVGGYLYTGGLVSDWLGVEVGYVHSGNADRAGGRTRSQGLNLLGVVRAPLGAFNVFAKGGAVYSETRVTTGLLSADVVPGKESGWGGAYGLGVGYDITPTSGLVLEWQRHEFRYPGLGRQDHDMTSLGYLWRF